MAEELVKEWQSFDSEVISGVEDGAARRITERRLSKRLELAHREYARATADMNSISAQVGSRSPAANEAPRIEQAAHARRLGYENYRQALEEFAHFVLHGKSVWSP